MAFSRSLSSLYSSVIFRSNSLSVQTYVLDSLRTKLNLDKIILKYCQRLQDFFFFFLREGVKVYFSKSPRRCEHGLGPNEAVRKCFKVTRFCTLWQLLGTNICFAASTRNDKAAKFNFGPHSNYSHN